MTKVSKDRKKALLARKNSLSTKGGFIFVKAGNEIRFRALPVDPEKEPGIEVIQFFLGDKFKGVISPRTIGEPCPMYEKYEKLKKGDEDDKALAEKFKPGVKFVVAAILKKDKSGKEVDEGRSPGLVQVAKQAYQQMIDLFLDEDEHGDFTDPVDGYDLKMKREGSGKNDTRYTVMNCKPSPLPKKYNKIWDAEDMLRKEIKTYDEIRQMLKEFLNNSSDEDDDGDEEETPRKKKKKVSSDSSTPTKKKKKKPSKSSDIDDEDDE